MVIILSDAFMNLSLTGIFFPVHALIQIWLSTYILNMIWTLLTFSVYVYSCWSVHIAVLLLSYSAGIDWCIFHNCIYPKYFLPVLRPSSGEDLLQKWCIDVILTECNLSLHEIMSVFQSAVRQKVLGIYTIMENASINSCWIR